MNAWGGRHIIFSFSGGNSGGLSFTEKKKKKKMENWKTMRPLTLEKGGLDADGGPCTSGGNGKKDKRNQNRELGGYTRRDETIQNGTTWEKE